jgi:hypothetical protein
MITPVVTEMRFPLESESRALLACEVYHLWRVAFEEADRALADSRRARVAGRADAYAAYRAAADREDAAARHWLAT